MLISWLRMNRQNVLKVRTEKLAAHVRSSGAVAGLSKDTLLCPCNRQHSRGRVQHVTMHSSQKHSTPTNPLHCDKPTLKMMMM